MYYGAKIPDIYVPNREKVQPCASFSLANPIITENGFTPDTAPIEYGTNGAADFRISALSVRNQNGPSNAYFSDGSAGNVWSSYSQTKRS